MKLKHWQGYGCVTATKISKTTLTNIYGEKMVRLVILVKGNHEWGLVTDRYTLYNWLLKRFDKSVTSYENVCEVTKRLYWSDNMEHCEYTFEYNLKN